MILNNFVKHNELKHGKLKYMNQNTANKKFYENME